MPDELAVGSRFSLRIAKERDTAVMQLADGRIFHGDMLSGVVNRMERFPRPSLNDASDLDVIYASEEMRAATVAWFAALTCPVLNPPTPYSAFGMTAHESIWRHRADALGVRVASLTLDAEQHGDQQADFHAVVIGETVLAMDDDPLPVSIVEASIALAHATGFNLIGLDFGTGTSGEWEFLRADIMPNLMRFGSRAIDAILAVIEGR